MLSLTELSSIDFLCLKICQVKNKSHCSTKKKENSSGQKKYSKFQLTNKLNFRLEDHHYHPHNFFYQIYLIWMSLLFKWYILKDYMFSFNLVYKVYLYNI